MTGGSTVRGRAGRAVARVLAVAMLGGALAVATVMATAASTGSPPSTVVYDRFDAQDVRLSMPGNGDPRGLAVFFHGQTGGVDNRMDDPWLQSLVRSGWAVASSDFHTASWGNAASTQDTENLVDWAEEQTGLKVGLFVSGSMGATVSLNALTHGVSAPNCWYGVKPAIDISKMKNVPGARRIIAEAFGGQPVPGDRNPALSLDELPLDTRYRMVASYGDTWVLRSENADLLQNYLQRSGADVSLLTVTGIHDDPSHFNLNDLLSFAAGCTGDGKGFADASGPIAVSD